MLFIIYFTSDLHFYHDKIIKHTGRNFLNSVDMNNKLIRIWNSKVKLNDEVYILGDFTMKGYVYAKNILSKLNGIKFLIKGNHDKFIYDNNFDINMFKWIKDYYEFEYKNILFVLFHYPIEEWNGIRKGSIHLHGHQHNKDEYNFENLEKGLRKFDVGVDANYMQPVSIEDIISFFSIVL